MPRKMRDSGVAWIGEVPEGWNVHSLLFSLRSKISDGPHETPKFCDQGIPFISIDSLNDTEHINFSSVKKFISEEDYWRFAVKTKLEEGDVLFTKAATIGKTAIVGRERFMVWSPLAILKADTQKLFSKFLYYIVNCKRLVDEVCLSGSHNTQINVGMRELEKVRVPIPSLPEQRAIAAYLDRQCAVIDAAVEEAKKGIEEYKAWKKSLVFEAVTGKREVESGECRVPSELRNSGVALDHRSLGEGGWIGQVPEGWKISRVKNLAAISGRIGFRGYTTADIVDEGDGALSLSPSNLKDLTMDFTKRTYISWKKYEESPEIQVEIGDIVYVKTGASYGKACLVKELPCKATLNPQLVVIKCTDCDSHFLNYVLFTPQAKYQAELIVTGGTIPTMSQEKMGNMKFIVPPLSEQRAIVAYLDEKCAAIDALIAEKEKLIEDLELYKRSLIFECVTGKREVM